MAAVERLTAKDLMFSVRDSFHSKVDIGSLIAVMEENQLLKKKEKKLLQRVDETAKKSFVYWKFFSADQSLSVDRLVRLFTDTENEKNVHFSKALLAIVSAEAQKSVEIATTSVALAIPAVDEVGRSQTGQILTTPSLPPFKYHYPLDNHPSAIFSSAGGVLYSPVYGVMVYIPAGAILGEEQVEVSFRLVTEEAKIQELLSSPLLEGSVLCSGVVEFEAKFVDAPDGVKFDEFQSDVWIELPHCLSFRNCSQNDNFRAFVVSDSRGKVEVEMQALFSEGYPYVNLPVRHFSRFYVTDSPKKKFKTPKDETAVSHLRMSMHRLCLSNGMHNEQFASPHTHSKQLKQRVTESSTYSTAAERRSRNIEIRKTLTQLGPCASLSDIDENVMEVDPPAPASIAYNTSLQQEDHNAPALSLMACVCQPADRHERDRWTADIVFAPLLPKALKDLTKCQMQLKNEMHTVAFHLDVRLQLIQLLSEPSTQEWLVELSTTEILSKHITTMTALLEEDLKSSKSLTFLPRAVAMVQKQGASLTLCHQITVEGSWPRAHCYITCEGETRRVYSESDGVKTISAQTEAGSSVYSTGSTGHQQHCHTSTDPPAQVAPEELHSPTPTTVQWERDRYVLALISIMVPEDQLVTLGEALGLPRRVIDQVMSGHTAGSVSNVGERAYEMFKRARESEQPLTFGKIFVILSEIDRSKDLVSILRSYIQSGQLVQSLHRANSGTPAETESADGPSALFIAWLCGSHPTLIPHASSAAMERAILSEEQLPLFRGLSRRMVCVWRMVGRFLSLPDWEIDEVDINSKRSHDGVSEACYQMLLRWSEHSQRPEDITYGRLMSALELTSLGVGAASDAIYYIYRYTLNLATPRNVPNHACT